MPQNMEGQIKEWIKKAEGTDNLKLKVKCYTNAIKLSPEYAALYLARGATYVILGKYRKAMKDCNKAIELNPEGLTYFARGIVYTKLGKHREAKKNYTRAIELSPEDANAYVARGLACVALEIPPAACDNFYHAGVLYLKHGERNDALRCIDMMEKVSPPSPLIQKLRDEINKQK